MSTNIFRFQDLSVEMTELQGDDEKMRRLMREVERFRCEDETTIEDGKVRKIFRSFCNFQQFDVHQGFLIWVKWPLEGNDRNLRAP